MGTDYEDSTAGEQSKAAGRDDWKSTFELRKELDEKFDGLFEQAKAAGDYSTALGALSSRVYLNGLQK